MNVTKDSTLNNLAAKNEETEWECTEVEQLQISSCDQKFLTNGETSNSNLEEEQELLTTSLMALTSHFAHVQLRVRQIVEAPTDERDALLKDLEEFAFRGIPEVPIPASGPLKMKEQLVTQLKTQIADLERFIAFLQCDLDDSKLKSLENDGKMNNVYNSYAAKKKSNSSIGLKRYGEKPSCQNEEINLQTYEKSTGEGFNNVTRGLMDKASVLMQMFATTHFGSKNERFQQNSLKKTFKGNHWGDLRAKLEVDIQEVASLASTLSFDRQKLAELQKTLKKKEQIEKYNQAIVASDIKKGKRLAYRKGRYNSESSTESDEEPAHQNWDIYRRKVSHRHFNDSDSIDLISKELMLAVRKNFAVTLQKLIEFGLRTETETTPSLIVPFLRCFNPNLMGSNESSESASSFVASNHNYYDNTEEYKNYRTDGRQMHAWEVILKYYGIKNGDEYNNTPARKLSQSFNLDIVSSKAVSSKQNLLSSIGMIISLHRPYKRSYSSHFKAFVCAGLNAHQLVEWLTLIFSCKELVQTCYNPDSYVARTGFRDSLRSMDILSKYDFDLPVDLSVRHFKNI